MATNPQPPAMRMLTIMEVSALLGITPTHAYKLHQQGKFPIPSVCVGRRVRFSPTLVSRFVEGQA